MMNYQCRYCKARMTAFIHGELELNVRRRVARHLDECANCDAEYQHRRELAQALQERVAHIGQPKTRQLQKIWGGVQRDLQPGERSAHLSPARYGLAALVLVVALLLPLTLGNHGVQFNIPTHPAPATAATRTPADQTVMTVALVVTDKVARTPNLALHNTPEPGATR